jgi:hypothetical protein
MDAVGNLPEATILQAVAHPEDVIGVTLKKWVFNLTGITADYEVFDKNLTYLYAADAIDGTWGMDEKDQLLLAQVPSGHWFYIGYETEEEDRFIMVIKQ